MLDHKPILHKINPIYNGKDLFAENQLEVFVLRLDLIHPLISGNKWFKLKYNLEEAKKQNKETILTFGGAFSNHIHATSVACKLAGFKSIGIIRGEKESATNFTLSTAQSNGMQLHFVTREEYKKRLDPEFIKELKKSHGNFYLIPEGGNNYLGAKGCAEIFESIQNANYIFCACGTGTTYAGLAQHLKPNQHLIGVSMLKGEGNLVENTQSLINELRRDHLVILKNSGELVLEKKITSNGILTNYLFGGFAKHNQELLDFKNEFESQTKIHLDYVYTSKLFYAAIDLIKQNKLKAGSKVILIHTGGLQGNKGYEDRYALNPNRNVKDAQG